MTPFFHAYHVRTNPENRGADMANPAQSVDSLHSGDVLITARQGRKLAGEISEMTLWRWLKAGIVPDPIVIRNRRYWWKSEFIAALTAGE
jgi:hypothetical protein